MQALSIITFNVTGLFDNVEKENLAIDVKRYFAEIASLQETEIKKWTKHNMFFEIRCIWTRVYSKWKMEKQYIQNNEKKKKEIIALLQLNPPNIKEANTISNQYTRKEN